MLNKRKTIKPPRNGNLFDKWSVIHLVTGVAFGWLANPIVALSMMILWEPLEIFILSPLLWRKGIVFGYESLNNSLSDIFFDALGVAVGYWILSAILGPPFRVFS